MINTDLSYIKINDIPIWRPPTFAPSHEDIYKGDYETCTGKVIADRVGWKYADMSLQWDALPQSMVDVLVNMSGACTLEFDDLSGEIAQEQIVRASAVGLRHRHTQGGETIWKNVSVNIKFIGSHTD